MQELNEANQVVQQPILKIPESIFGSKGTKGEWKWKTDPIPKSIGKIEISPGPSTTLRHATSSRLLWQILFGQGDAVADGIVLEGSVRSGDALPLVYCGVALSSAELSPIEKYSDAYNFATQQRYGAAVIQFKFEDVVGNANCSLKVLGTKTAHFWKEVSQMLLVDFGNNFQRPDYLKNFDRGASWTLYYDYQGRWTHPEFVFSDKVKVPWEKVMIRFEDHNCVNGSNLCQDCIIYRKIKNKGSRRVVLVGRDYNRSEGGRDIKINKETLEELGLLSKDKFYCTKDLAIYLFAMRIPTDKRDLFLGSFATIFEEDTIKLIKRHFALNTVIF